MRQHIHTYYAHVGYSYIVNLNLAISFKGKEWGNPNGEKVLGLHGWLDNSATFDRLAKLLPLSRLRFISLDLPGHGLSSKMPSCSWYRWSDYMSSIARVVEHLNWNRFSIIAHSMGAKIAFLYAGCFPEKVENLVSLDIIRPMPGGKPILINPQEGFYYDWDWSLIHRSNIDFSIKLDKSTLNSETKGQPLEEYVRKMTLATWGVPFMTEESAKIILSRGSRLVSKDPDLYVLTRDRRVLVYDVLESDKLFFQFCQHLKCNILIIQPSLGVCKIDPRQEEFLNLYKKNLRTFRMERVEGTHHAHLNNPESKEWGNQSGEKLLGLHGWMDNSATWDLLAPLLKLNKLHFICLDLPGHGQSSHLPSVSWYRWIDYVMAIARVADYLKWNRFSMIGHSMGACSAFIYAGCFPEQIQKFISCDVHVPFPGGNRILFKPQSGFYNDWNWPEVYRTYFDVLLKIEQTSETDLKGKPMELLVDRLMQATSDMHFMSRNSARVLLQRGTRQVSKNPDLYVVTRDRKLAIYDFLVADQHVNQICRQMTCDLLIIMAEKGVPSFYPSFGLEMLKVYEENLKVYKFERVTGTHHEHLNNPQKFAPLINDFLS